MSDTQTTVFLIDSPDLRHEYGGSVYSVPGANGERKEITCYGMAHDQIGTGLIPKGTKDISVLWSGEETEAVHVAETRSGKFSFLPEDYVPPRV